MKFFKAFTILSALLLGSQLVGCTGMRNGLFNPTNTSSSTVNKQNRAPAKTTYRSRKSSNDNYAISPNDFNNVNLDNNGQEQGNLWEKMRSGLTIPNPESHPEVQAQIRWFMTHQGYLQRTTERARPYMYIVYDEVKKRGLPMELVLLPINESGYYPFSYSSAGATGIWQLMPGTATNFGLKHDFWYDGRRDIFDSTNAALDYLTYLANYFNGDWLLAIAAYDTGEGNVENAIARNVREGKPTDFWSLRLASETRSYVPRLLALAAIIAHPDRYPVQLPPIEAKPVVAKVKINNQLKLSDAARLAGISINQLKALNPGLSRFATDPSSDSHILLPISTIENFKQNLGNMGAPTGVNYGHYKTQRGDTLASIADRFNTTPDQIRQMNSILGRSIRPGTVLLVPNVSENFTPSTQINLDKTSLNLADEDQIDTSSTSEETDSKTATSSASANSTDMKRHLIKHQIKRGETLMTIANHYHVDTAQLKSLNPNLNPQALKPGQVIVVTATNAPLPDTSTNAVAPSPSKGIKSAHKKIHSKVKKKHRTSRSTASN